MRFIRSMFVRVGLFAILAAMFFGSSIAVAGQKEWLVHSFDGTHGDPPMGNLVADAAGNLYGTAFQGGTYNWGAPSSGVMGTLLPWNGFE